MNYRHGEYSSPFKVEMVLGDKGLSLRMDGPLWAWEYVAAGDRTTITRMKYSIRDGLKRVGKMYDKAGPERRPHEHPYRIKR